MKKRAPAAARKLSTYRKKRDFTLTSEPSPEVEAAPGRPDALRFMIHKHDATALHYDVRLEIDGVLASWAVPKGPSPDPSVKRLAVETEDHPLAYATFEGRIPDDAYGGGDSIIWESGTYHTVPPGQERAMRRAGRLTVELAGHKLEGRWHLVRTRPRGGKAQWLMFKAKDAHARPGVELTEERPESVKSGRTRTRGPVRKRALTSGKHPRPVTLLRRVWPPMLARLSTPAEASEAPHVFEVKYDGFRALAGLSGGKLSLQSRNGKELAKRFPALAGALRSLRVREAVLDGEIVALDSKGRSRFQLLQNVDTGKDLDVRFVAFDLLWLDGEDLRARPLEERRELLESVLAGAKLPLQLSERLELPLPKALTEARRRGWEGLIAKRQGSPYTGARGLDWLKLKVIAGQEVVLLGYLPITNGKPQIGALIVGVNGPDGWREVGKVGTGYTTKTRTELKRLLDKDRVEVPAAANARAWKGAVWVKPRHVANVNYTEWTEDGKLRHPVFQGLRDDKRPEDVVRERVTSRVKGAVVPLRRAGASGDKRVPRALAAHTAVTPRVRAARKAAKAAQPAAGSASARTNADLLTSPERVLYPKDGLTKADVFAYYGQVAPLLVPVLHERPLAVQQWPAGIRAPGFFRHQLSGTPAWVPTFPVQHEEKVLQHVNVEDARVLQWLANQSALTLHMWSSHRPELDSPDWVAFDLDPGEGGWESVLEVAAVLRAVLEELELASVPKTSGKRGLHVLVPLAPGHTYAQTQAFASAVMERLAHQLPDVATTERSIKKRGGRLYLDAMQNARGKTMVAPYSLRAVDGATFSAPLQWSEVGRRLDPKRFTLRTLQKRLDAVGDLFAPALRSTQRLPAPGKVGAPG